MAPVRLIPPNGCAFPAEPRVHNVTRRDRPRRHVWLWTDRGHNVTRRRAAARRPTLCTGAARAPAPAPALTLALTVALALAVALGGCGAGSGDRAPSLAALPTVPGFRVVAQQRSCDAGAASYCTLALVAIDPRYRSSEDFMAAFGHHLRALGWQRTGADTGDERAAASPGDRLRVTYATAYGDLKATARGWTHRPDEIDTALSRAFFGGQSVLSILLELGPGAA